MTLGAVKVCGVRRPADVAPIVALGATHIGVVLVPASPRAATVDDARAVRAALEATGADVQLVGVVQGLPIEAVVELARSIPLDIVQLHGGFDDDAADALRAALPDVACIQAIAVDADGQWSAPPSSAIDHLLLDTKKAGRFGGTGAAFRWDRAARPPGRFFVAGGLTPDNVADAVRALDPWGVDLSSGVESAPGVKDPALLAALGDALRDLGWPSPARPATSNDGATTPFDMEAR